MGFWIAWKFLTVFPGPTFRDETGRGLGSSLPWFPLVGLILGAILTGLDQLFDLFLPEPLNSSLLLVTLVILTGALHLDGLMDTCDGFAVRSTAADRLRVMADSQVGGFGVAGAICLLILKLAGIVSLPDDLRATGLLLTPALARWSVAWAILAFPSARKGGLGDVFRQGTGWGMIPALTLVALVIASGFLSWIGPALVAGLGLLTFAIALWFSARLGGLTGDTYGSIIEISEVAILISVVIIGETGGTSWLGSYL